MTGQPQKRTLRGLTGRPRGSRRVAPGAPTFITGLQVVLNGGGERLIDPPLLSEDVSLQASQDGAYLRIHILKRPFVTTTPTEAGQVSPCAVTIARCLKSQLATRLCASHRQELLCQVPPTGPGTSNNL